MSAGQILKITENSRAAGRQHFQSSSRDPHNSSFYTGNLAVKEKLIWKYFSAYYLSG